MTRFGRVSVVGAGPGDPELLTWRAVQRLQSADLVLYDGLVPDAVVNLAASADRWRVSRRPDEIGPSPAQVAATIASAARRGARVVRLRCGDPFVLARGAEELLALIAAGVPFEIVPGLTTASAAPALAGIPLTHRGIASGFLTISGHARTAYEGVLSSLPPNSVTVVVLMGLGERSAIAELLAECEWRLDTPAAVVLNASREDASVRSTTLGALRFDARSLPAGAAGVIVIGDVVAIGEPIRQAIQQEWESDFHLLELEEASWRR